MTDSIPTSNIVADLCTDFPVQYTRALNAAQDLATLLDRRFRLDIQYTSAGLGPSSPTIAVEVVFDPPLTSRKPFPTGVEGQITFVGPSLGDVYRQIVDCITSYLATSIPQVAERARTLASLQRLYVPPTV